MSKSKNIQDEQTFMLSEQQLSSVADIMNRSHEELMKRYGLTGDNSTDELSTLLESKEKYKPDATSTSLDIIAHYIQLDAKMNIYKKMIEEMKSTVIELIKNHLTESGESSIKFPTYGANVNLKTTTTYEYSEVVEHIQKGLEGIKKKEREAGEAVPTSKKVIEIRRVRA